ncbi:MAG: TetR/AcrR family transcriptional regulator [Acidimicrobiales bacterium]|nr:TetR/AcrR family transcriptional regulator [Acidimicrobiales bacterium]
MNAPRTARERARAELTAEITEAARRQLAEVGPTDLSLRAISRDLGMASSALYRYFPSRDALLTALIVAAYDAVGEAAESAEATVERDDLMGRWRATTRAVRTWALAHPHEYALIYGSPVPGYAAPTDTIDPAGRVGLLLAGILADATETGALGPVPGPDPADGLLEPGLGDQLGTDPAHAVAGVLAWTWLFGVVSFELFGHYQNVIADRDAWFDDAMLRLARLAGLAS